MFGRRRGVLSLLNRYIFFGQNNQIYGGSSKTKVGNKQWRGGHSCTLYSITRVSEDITSRARQHKIVKVQFWWIKQRFAKKTVDIGLTEGADYHFKVSEA